MLKTRTDAVERVAETVLACESRGSVVICREKPEDGKEGRKEVEGALQAPEGVLMVTDGKIGRAHV